MRADGPPLTRIATGTEIFDIAFCTDLQAGSVLGCSFTHQATEQWRIVCCAHHPTHLDQCPSMFHRLPSPGIHQETLRNFDPIHRTLYPFTFCEQTSSQNLKPSS